MSNKQKDIAKAKNWDDGQIKSRIKRRVAKLKTVEKPQARNTVMDNRLEILITVVNRVKGEYYADLLQSFDINMQFIAFGHGTADASMLSMFGFSDTDKAIIFSVIQSDKMQSALDALDEKFRTIKNGKGIAYSVPMSSMIGTLIFGFLSNNRLAVKDGKEGK